MYTRNIHTYRVNMNGDVCSHGICLYHHRIRHGPMTSIVVVLER